MVRVDEQDDVRLADLLPEVVALLRERGGVDNGGGDVFGRADAGRDGYLREDGLDLGGDEDVFDEGGDDGAFSDFGIAADADADWVVER